MTATGRQRVDMPLRPGSARLSDTAIDVLLDEAGIWVATCDVAGNLNFMSPALQEFFGFPFSTAPEADLIERFQLFSADGCTPLAPCELPLGRARRGEVVRDALIATRLGGGDARFLRCSGAPLLTESGHLDGAVVVVHEVTNELAAEREQTVLRERLVATINHEFRTPLTKLVGHAELLDDLLDTLPGHARCSLSAVRESAAELRTVLDTLSGLVDLQGHMRLRRRATDVAALTRDVGRRFESHSLARSLRLSCSVPRRLMAEIDPDKTRDAMCALVRNALQYAPAGSEVELTIAWDRAYFCVQVCDRGPGILPEDRGRLVEPFERGSHPQQPLHSRGLGLAVARTVATAHGGHLTLTDNEPGLRAALTIPRTDLWTAVPETSATQQRPHRIRRARREP